MGDDQPTFYYDLASPECYLAAERVVDVLGVVPEWTPIRGDAPAFRCAEERDIHMLEIERRARERGMQPLRWPPGWPADAELALLVATYAKQIGRGVAFSLAAFRQAFAAGRDLSSAEGVLISAAACEMHPNAVLRNAQTGGVREALDAATQEARDAGVSRVPAVRVGGAVFLGDEGIDEAAARAVAP
ncbi:MAG: DsbA family protein [Actinomycetota bacterium]|nr:DsbA family protein [Actinomycetota bacterium]